MTAPKIPISRCTVAIVGTGAAGYNAALCLKSLGVTDIIMVSEGKLCGTSRNTGSDKQTYYKISQGGAELDSVRQMAQTLFDGGSMHGDIALVHSALSARGFYKLVELGVPFPFNRFGEYAGYKTDHDPARRGSSIGPLTSKLMTEQLECAVGDVKLLDGYRVARILTDKGSCKGLLLVNIATGELTAINASSIIFATGGPAHIYAQTVYPHSQTGATGIALAAGAKGANLGEWQYGLASTEFRWNVSGTYQQVLPRYISTDQSGGDEREFLADYYSSDKQMLENIFRKGYQWPFDAKRTEGSSQIDLLVYNETVIQGRSVYMDFTRNPSCIGEQLSPSYENLSDEVSSYLQSSGALFGTPIERLAHMNPQAIEIYASNCIDLYSQPLEVAVCAQHNNGGLAGNLWFESNIKRLFPVGEVAGSFGAARPGGSALNATQVESLRAAQYIAAQYDLLPMDNDDFAGIVNYQLEEEINRCESMRGESSDIVNQRKRLQIQMDKYASIHRSADKLSQLLDSIKLEIKAIRYKHGYELAQAYQNYDIALTQLAYVSAMLAHIESGGTSRGSYLVDDLPATQDIMRGYVLETSLDALNLACTSEKVSVRPIPESDDWFENVWRSFRNGEIYK